MLRFIYNQFFLFLFLFISIANIFGQKNISTVPKLEDILESNITKILRNEGHVFQYGHAGLEYIKGFKDPQLMSDYEEIYYETASNYTVQILYYIPQNLLTPLTNQQIYQAITDVSSLKKSYVVRDDRRDPFMTNVQEFTSSRFREKAIIDHSSTLKEVPIFTEKYLRAKDTRFGTIEYNVAYRYTMGRFMIIMKNIDPINYLFYKIADPNQFTTVITIQPVQGGLLYCVQAFSSVKNLKTVEKKIDLRTFFSRRLEGIKGWFFRQVYGIEVKQGVFPVSVKLDD
ncbi:MAG: DUF6675 family protein [Spirochaetia bacterium]